MERHVSSLQSQKLTTRPHRGSVEVHHIFTTHLHLAFFTTSLNLRTEYSDID